MQQSATHIHLTFLTRQNLVRVWMFFAKKETNATAEETNTSMKDNSAPPEIASKERQVDENVGLYTIKEGDNLNSIAQKFFLKSYDIKKLNGINQVIITGKQLKLPLPQYKINAIEKGVYIVKKGDTLGHIALDFSSSNKTSYTIQSIKR